MAAIFKSGIAPYGLTAQDIGLTLSTKATSGSQQAPLPSRRKAKADPGSTAASKYSDGAGHSWSGRVPRPAWLKAAIDAGQTLDDLLVGRKRKAVGRKAATPSKKATDKLSKALRPDKNVKPASPASKVKYKDEAGNSWSGRGPKPGWLRAAIDDGKSLDDFLT
jgi:DNA-binding protein H-NS